MGFFNKLKSVFKKTNDFEKANNTPFSNASHETNNTKKFVPGGAFFHKISDRFTKYPEWAKSEEQKQLFKEGKKEIKKNIKKANKGRKEIYRKFGKKKVKSINEELRKINSPKSREIKPLKANVMKPRYEKEFRRKIENSRRQASLQDIEVRANRYKENLITAMERNIFAAEITDVISDIIKRTPTEEFLEMYYTDTLPDHDFYYSPIDNLSKVMSIIDTYIPEDEIKVIDGQEVNHHDYLTEIAYKYYYE